MSVKQGWTGRCYEDFEVDDIVLSKRESKSHPERGIVQIKTIGFNQDGLVVIEFKRTIMVYKREYLPKLPIPNLTQP